MSGHGITQYGKGCRCSVCKAAKRKVSQAHRERVKQRAQQDPGEIPHGTADGYGRWHCRCNDCRDVYMRNRRAQRAARSRNPDPERIPHGTRNGYENWGCRCDACHKAVVDRQAAREPETVKRSVARANASMQAKTLPGASRRYQPWTGPELEVAARTDLTSRAAALMIGRTTFAVQRVRYLLRTDPRKINLAGLVEPPAIEGLRPC